MSPAAGESFWRSWQEPLTSFSRATGLTVAAYGRELDRKLGPLVGAPLAQVLAEHGAWREAGAAAAIEAALVARAVAALAPVSERVGDLVLSARPLFHGARLIGAITAGWVADRFMTSLEVTSLARRLGVDQTRMWRVARAEAPTAPARLTVLMQLLDTLIAAHGAHQLSLERADELSRTRDRFLARAAHELRSPLATIAMRIELLLADTSLSPAHRKSLEKIAASTVVESNLIEDLIDAGRTLTGNLRITKTEVALDDLLADCVDAALPAARKRDVALSFERADAESPTRVLGDEVRLRQAFSNLINNSLKFTPAGGTVRIRLRTRDGGAEVSVTDSGEGIDAEALPRVFDPFVKTERNNPSGLGLGLAITRQIVEQHDGTIVADSAGAGRGATFTVVLPAMPVSP